MSQAGAYKMSLALVLDVGVELFQWWVLLDDIEGGSRLC